MVLVIDTEESQPYRVQPGLFKIRRWQAERKTIRGYYFIQPDGQQNVLVVLVRRQLDEPGV